MGKGKETTIDTSSHSAAPLSTLKDPASFGPPPKHIAAHGAEVANASAGNDGATGSARKPPSIPRPGPSTQRSTQAPNQDVETRPGVASAARVTPSAPASSSGAGPPQLPPRLPPRRHTQAEHSTSPPPPYEAVPSEEATAQTGYINQAAAGRLGNAGVSVPGLNIGSGGQSPASTGRHPAAPSSQRQMNELSSRFAKMGRSGTPDTDNPRPTNDTTWAQKQSTLKTADSFRRDPPSVSVTDARSAASTANNFRQRHGDQVTAGVDTANVFGQRHGAVGQALHSAAPEEQNQDASNGTLATAVAAKKRPPPPPKKGALSATGTGSAPQSPPAGGEPPPIPLASKPR